MKKAFLLLTVFALAGCTPLEDSAKDAAAASQAVIQAEQAAHRAACELDSTPAICVNINKAIDAQNALVTAAEIYCGWPANPNPAQLAQAGAMPCQHIASGKAALQAAVLNLNAIVGTVKTLETGAAK